jgi:hypothetical protein
LFALYSTRIIFLLPKQFFSELKMEAEVIITLLIKLSIGKSQVQD